MRQLKLTLMAVIGLFIFSGCTTLQTVQKVDAAKLHNVCIVEHKAVREEVLATIQEVLKARGIKTTVVPGSYQIVGNQWTPTYQHKDVESCDAVFFYVANWTWDVTMYMHFATIWVVTPDEKPVGLGNVRYDARASLNKYINAHNKIAELTQELIGVEVKALAEAPKPAAPAPQASEVGANKSVVVAETKPATASTPRDDAAQLEKLKSLKDRGIINEQEYNNKKKEILDRM